MMNLRHFAEKPGHRSRRGTGKKKELELDYDALKHVTRIKAITKKTGYLKLFPTLK